MLSEQGKGYIKVVLIELTKAETLGSGYASRRSRKKRRGRRLQRAINVLMWFVPKGKSRINEI